MVVMIGAPSNDKQLVIRDTYERIVFGEVYIPNHIDAHGTTMTREEVKRVAYDFLRKGFVNKIDEQHSWKESGCYVVESFIARDGDPDFVPGSWVLGTKIEGDALWQKVLNGEYNGYSIAGYSEREKAYVSLTRTRESDIETEFCLADGIDKHSHMIHIIFDDGGKIIPTWTSESFGHSHEVILSTATEIEASHNHRFVSVHEIVDERYNRK